MLGSNTRVGASPDLRFIKEDPWARRAKDHPASRLPPQALTLASRSASKPSRGHLFSPGGDMDSSWRPGWQPRRATLMGTLAHSRDGARPSSSSSRGGASRRSRPRPASAAREPQRDNSNYFDSTGHDSRSRPATVARKERTLLESQLREVSLTMERARLLKERHSVEGEIARETRELRRRTAGTGDTGRGRGGDGGGGGGGSTVGGGMVGMVGTVGRPPREQSAMAHNSAQRALGAAAAAAERTTGVRVGLPGHRSPSPQKKARPLSAAPRSSPSRHRADGSGGRGRSGEGGGGGSGARRKDAERGRADKSRRPQSAMASPARSSRRTGGTHRDMDTDRGANGRTPSTSRSSRPKSAAVVGRRPPSPSGSYNPMHVVPPMRPAGRLPGSKGEPSGYSYEFVDPGAKLAILEAARRGKARPELGSSSKRAAARSKNIPKVIVRGGELLYQRDLDRTREYHGREQARKVHAGRGKRGHERRGANWKDIVISSMSTLTPAALETDGVATLLGSRDTINRRSTALLGRMDNAKKKGDFSKYCDLPQCLGGVYSQPARNGKKGGGGSSRGGQRGGGEQQQQAPPPKVVSQGDMDNHISEHLQGLAGAEDW